MGSRHVLGLFLGLLCVHAHGFVREDEGIGFYVGVDARQSIATGDYAGLPNPNLNRLTLLFDGGAELCACPADDRTDRGSGAVANRRRPRIRR